MNEHASQSGPGPGGRWSRPRVLRDILVVATPIVVFGVAGNIVGLATLAGGAIINAGYVLAIVAGGLVLKRQGSSWREIGLEKPASGWKTALAGLGAGGGAVVVFAVVQMIAAGLLTAMGLSASEVDQSRFNAIEGNLPLFTLMVVLAWTTIAFGEELFYRAFVITRLMDYAGMGRKLAIVISAIIFGVVHFAEGPVGIVSNGAMGILFGWIYVRSGRNLWITIIAHGLINTLRFTLLYVGVA